MPNRENARDNWLRNVGLNHFFLKPLTGGASFRKYFRLEHSGISQIVMDAPPDKEPLQPFIMLSAFFLKKGIRAPKVHAFDEQLGFALLDDFGDCLLSDKLTLETADVLYRSAIDVLLSLQKNSDSSDYLLPYFNNKFIQQELNLFKEWFLTAYLQISLTGSEEFLIEETFEKLCQELTAQPQVIIHRDYHSRNIMIPELGNDSRLAVIDFQDAMLGPVTYDLVSLLKDCYVQWPRDMVMDWVTYFYEQSTAAKQLTPEQFIRAFDFCGLQRHLKVLGVFSRLHLRDNKPGYLKDLPLTLHYVMSCLESYEDFHDFFLFMQQRVSLP